MTLTAALEDLDLPCNASEAQIEAACEKIRDRIVLEALNVYVPQHKFTADFRLGARDFKSALWIEGDPSLEDRARAANENLVTLTKEVVPEPDSENAGGVLPATAATQVDTSPLMEVSKQRAESYPCRANDDRGILKIGVPDPVAEERATLLTAYKARAGNRTSRCLMRWSPWPQTQ